MFEKLKVTLRGASGQNLRNRQLDEIIVQREPDRAETYDRKYLCKGLYIIQVRERAEYFTGGDGIRKRPAEAICGSYKGRPTYLIKASNASKIEFFVEIRTNEFLRKPPSCFDSDEYLPAALCSKVYMFEGQNGFLTVVDVQSHFDVSHDTRPR